MEISAQAWSEQMFGNSSLGDVRRTRSLVDIGSRLASHVGQSLASCCRSDSAAALGGYRFIENPKVDADRIAESAFTSVAAEAARLEVVLAVEDTTTMLYEHSVAEWLGTAGSSPQPRQVGIPGPLCAAGRCQKRKYNWPYGTAVSFLKKISLHLCLGFLFLY